MAAKRRNSSQLAAPLEARVSAVPPPRSLPKGGNVRRCKGAQTAGWVGFKELQPCSSALRLQRGRRWGCAVRSTRQALSIWTDFSYTKCPVSFFSFMFGEKVAYIFKHEIREVCVFSLYIRKCSVPGGFRAFCSLISSLLTRGLKCGSGMVT